MSQMGLRPSVFLSLLAVLLAGFWLRVALLDTFPPGVSYDEGYNIMDGFHFARTGRLPLQEDVGSEPFRPVAGAVSSLLFGNSLWTYRYSSALAGLLSIAAAFWVCRQCFAEQPASARDLAGLVAAIVMATALGHITISRSVYRAAPLAFCVAMTIGVTVKALRTNRWRDYVLSAAFAALGIYSYATALFVPAIYPLLALWSLLFERESLRRRTAGLLFCGLCLLLFTAPLIQNWLLQPQSIAARASDVGAIERSTQRSIEAMLEQYFVQGDENPQYNVADAPLVSPLLAPLFALGIAALLMRIWRPVSLILLALLVLTALPTMLTNEISQGLRMVGAFGVIPIVAGAGMLPLHALLRRTNTNAQAKERLLLLVALILFALTVSSAAQTYFAFWEEDKNGGRKWRIYDKELSAGEWFFRSDRQRLMDWIKAQDKPLLAPVEELNKPAELAFLIDRFADIRSQEVALRLPVDTILVSPWSLERGGFLSDARHYALLMDDTITLLPPLDDDSLERLRTLAAQGQELINADSNIPVVARYAALESALPLSFQGAAVAGEPIARFNDELELRRWYGARTIDAAGKYQYTLDWAVNREVSHRYAAFLQLLSPQWQRLAGEDRYLLRFLYPSVAWDAGEIVSTAFELDIAELPAPGAYRLAVGAWHLNGGLMPVENLAGAATDSAASVGWLKVPQAAAPLPPPEAIPADISFGDSFRLLQFHFEKVAADEILATLYWTALVDRPLVDATIFLHAVDSQGNILAQSDRRPWDGQYPTFIWGAGEVVATQHKLSLPQLEGARIYAGMYRHGDFARLAALQDGARLPDDRAFLGELSALVDGAKARS